MASPNDPDDRDVRLERCIRDLSALNALPWMCVGRPLAEVLDLVLDALPTALSCDLIFLALAGSPPPERARRGAESVPENELPALRGALDGPSNADGARAIPGAGLLFCLEVELPLRGGHGRLVAGRRTPFDPETDRVLIRSAANLVGAALESATVLEAAQRKDELLAMLGHELRAPIAPIATAVELLAHHPDAAREQQVIERHTRHLARLVDDLLDISRVTRGHVELRSEQVSLTSVLERAVELAEPLIVRHRHTLLVDDSEGVTLRGDSVRLAQIFGNLLTNAAKFMPPGGRIDVRIERPPGKVRVAVRDTGRGIAREQLGRIFEPFVQVDREKDALRGGLGLGLAIVANLAERHGGSIVATSDGPGTGATFTVELPTVERMVAAAERVVARPTEARRDVRVLVVDDNVDLAELVSEALQREGFATAVAHDASAALEQWRRFGPHAAVLDVGLPQIDGYELARRVRQEHGAGPTLIAATGYGERRDRLRAHDAGFDCHFVKPVKVGDLVRVLDERVVIHQGRP